MTRVHLIDLHQKGIKRGRYANLDDLILALSVRPYAHPANVTALLVHLQEGDLPKRRRWWHR